jgi:hypothetical protein
MGHSLKANQVRSNLGKICRHSCGNIAGGRRRSVPVHQPSGQVGGCSAASNLIKHEMKRPSWGQAMSLAGKCCGTLVLGLMILYSQCQAANGCCRIECVGTVPETMRSEIRHEAGLKDTMVVWSRQRVVNGRKHAAKNIVHDRGT